MFKTVPFALAKNMDSGAFKKYFISVAIAFFVAALIIEWLGWASFSVWAWLVGGVSLVVFVVSICFVRRLLLIHPIADRAGEMNFFLSLDFKKRELIRYKKGDAVIVLGKEGLIVPISITVVGDLPLSGKMRKSVEYIDSFNFPFNRKMPAWIPIGAQLQLVLMDEYDDMEVIDFLISDWSDGRSYFLPSYKDYVKESFKSFMFDFWSLLEAYILPEEIENDAFSEVVAKKIRTFLVDNFSFYRLSNVERIGISLVY